MTKEEKVEAQRINALKYYYDNREKVLEKIRQKKEAFTKIYGLTPNQVYYKNHKDEIIGRRKNKIIQEHYKNIKQQKQLEIYLTPYYYQ